MSLFDLAKSIYDTVDGLLTSEETKQRREDEHEANRIANMSDDDIRREVEKEMPPDF